MKSSYLKYSKFIALAAVLPFVYGCGSGTGVGSLVGFLFGGGSGNVGDIALLGSASGGASGFRC